MHIIIKSKSLSHNENVKSQVTSKTIANVYFISLEITRQQDLFFLENGTVTIFYDNLNFVVLPMVSEVWLPTTRRSIGWLLSDLCKEVEGDDSVVPFTLASACGWKLREKEEIVINSLIQLHNSLYLHIFYLYHEYTQFSACFLSISTWPMHLNSE